MADTGWLSPSTNTTSAGWTGPGNVYAQDGTNATVTVAANVETPYFRVDGFVGLATALSGATAIVGIECQFYGRTNNVVAYDYVLVGNAVAGTPQCVDTTKVISLPVSATTSGYGPSAGGPTDLWGGKTGPTPWVVSDFDSSFGVSGAWAGNATSGSTVTWDYVRLKVYYTPGGSTPKQWWNGWGGN
jgi:hypothetical protein